MNLAGFGLITSQSSRQVSELSKRRVDISIRKTKTDEMVNQNYEILHQNIHKLTLNYGGNGLSYKFDPKLWKTTLITDRAVMHCKK